jgi:hypothetical protein
MPIIPEVSDPAGCCGLACCACTPGVAKISPKAANNVEGNFIRCVPFMHLHLPYKKLSRLEYSRDLQRALPSEAAKKEAKL